MGGWMDSCMVKWKWLQITAEISQIHTFVDTVILLQIVMVCPWIHLVKNHESQLKKKGPKWKMLGSLCNETVNLKTDSQTLYYSILKLKYSSSIKAKRNMHHQTTSIRTATEITWTGYCYKNTCSDWLIDRCLGPTRCMLWIILRLLGFSCVREAGRRTHTCRYM